MAPRMARMGDFVKIKTGKLDANAADDNGKYPFFTCAREISWIDTYAYDCDAVLVAGNGDLNVKHYQGKFNAYQRTYIIESNDPNELDTRYLFLFMDRYVDTLRTQSIGGVIKYIKLGNLTDALIPLPSIEEQRRIAAILDKADAIRRKREQARTLADDFLRSAFLEMFGDPGVNPKGWDEVEVADVVTAVRDGPHVSPEYSEEGIPILSTRNIRPGELLLSNMKHLSEKSYVELTRKFRPERGDVLLTKGGTTGFAKQVDWDWPFAVWVHLAVLRPSERILPSFLEQALNTQYCYQQSQKYTRGIANRDLGLTRIRKIRLYLPPIEIQRKYEEYLAQANSWKTRLKSGLSESRSLFSSLSQRAFKGELQGQ